MAPTTGKAYQRRWWTLLVLSVSLLVISLDNTILNVALPTIERELGASASDLQWIVDSYTLVFAGLLLIAGQPRRPLRPPPRIGRRAWHLRRGLAALRARQARGHAHREPRARWESAAR